MRAETWQGGAAIGAMFLLAAVLGGAGVVELMRSDDAAIRVIDGDTLEISGERIRLNGIDAPEMPGHCRRGRTCVPGDPLASRDELAAGVDLPGEIYVRRLKRDPYGRTVAQVTIGGVDLSCRQLLLGAARFTPRWDEHGMLEATCEAASGAR